MHDGQNLFDATRASYGEWRVDETFDAAAEDGSIREAIVVGVENTARRIWEYTPTRDDELGDGGGGDLYLRMLIEELKPRIDGALRTLPARETTAILGSSLGGLISAHAATTSTATFGLVGAMSPSTWWDGAVLLDEVAATKGKSPRPIRVYVDSGDAGPSRDDVVNTAKLAAAYRDVGFVEGADLLYVVDAGAEHNETYWAKRLPGALRFLLGAGR
jgi:predicted alpha/beta superfamily hydrolase